MSRTILIATLVALVAGCAGPRIATDLRTRTAAGGVVVIFGNRGTETTPHYCPIFVVTTDNECASFGGKPLDYVCRYTSDAKNKTKNQKRVYWSGFAATDVKPPPKLLFNIAFDKNPGPCQNDMGAGEAATKNCIAKASGEMDFTGDEASYEYEVTSGDCKPLDPYIVFRR